MSEQASIFRRNFATIVAAALVVVVLAASFFFASGQPGAPGGSSTGAGDAGTAGAASGAFVVLVHDGAGQTHRFPLDEQGVHPIRTELGENTVVIQDGRVWIDKADCPNGDCLHQKPLEAPGPQLICLPHKLWVEIAPDGERGSTMNETAVSPNDDALDTVAR